MVSRELKKRAQVERGKRSGKSLVKAAGTIMPLISREDPEEFLNLILEEYSDLNRYIDKNPGYREILKEEIRSAIKDYRGVLYGGKVVDSWDRVTSAAGLVADAAGPFSAGAGNVASAIEEIAEGIPKMLYAVYYVTKTGDKKAIPVWTAAETMSFIPYLGDAVDMTNIYIDRSRKMTRKRAVEKFKERISGLERKVSEDEELGMAA